MSKIKLTQAQYQSLASKDENSYYLITDHDLEMYKGTKLISDSFKSREPNYLCFTAKQANSTITITGNQSTPKNFQYSFDRSIWVEFIPETTIVTLTNKGDKVYFKGNNPNGINVDLMPGGYRFVMTGQIAASGDIMSLIDNGACNTVVIPNDYCFSALFQYCTSLIQAPELPATTLKYCCYFEMFYGCTSLIAPPKLPAITLAEGCYREMFRECTSLMVSPILPATTLVAGCYYNMFYGTQVIPDYSNIDFASQEVVSSGGLQGLFSGTLITDSYLRSILPINPVTNKYYLPVTTLVDHCYSNMFNGCTSLKTAPELPATTLAEYCYGYMFAYCTALTTAPVLPATTLADYCYSGMFANCTSLTIPPALPAITLTICCYAGMFENCTSLATTPELLVTSLATFCYGNMFLGCTSLTTVSKLPATELAINCYGYMFTGCTSLYVSETQSTEASQAWTIPNSGLGQGDFTMARMFAGCLGTRESGDSPNFHNMQKTYYTQNVPV